MNYLVIKEADLFLLTDANGNIRPTSDNGLYMQDTRFLDSYVLSFNDRPLTLLQSTSEKNYISTVYLTNGETVNDGVTLKKDSIEVIREQIVRQGVLYERITVTNYAVIEIKAQVKLAFSSRFSDLFEARGMIRDRRGVDLEPVVQNGNVELGYVGLDNIRRGVKLRCEQATAAYSDRFEIELALQPNNPFRIEVAVIPSVDMKAAEAISFPTALQELEDEYRKWMSSCMQITSDSESFNAMLYRGLIDTRTLVTDLGDGPFLVAGIPWFAVPFGRDSLIAALQSLPFQPEVAKGTLRTLARLQGTEVNRERAEQPGKILHEVRYGEMANLGEVPYKRYYGSIDSTPLFLILCVEYYRLTGDRGLVEEIFPNILRAIEWMDKYADIDGDGLIEYHAEHSKGLSVQSWKDSANSMIHPNGQIGVSPMAVSEVQGYIYHAKVGLAELLSVLGEEALAQRLQNEAASLKVQFNEKFWMPDKRYFAIALDCEKTQIRTVTSDPGHCLWSDIVDQDKIDPTVEALMDDGLFSGWGIRTMSSKENVYNPLSYHNGSVWAHDNSLILLGLSKQGRTEAVNRLATALLQASKEFEYQRLPELFCGHGMEAGRIVHYPVACSPQAWASGTPLVVAQALLGVKVDVEGKRITLSPTWPEFLNRLEVTNMYAGNTHVSFVIDRHNGLTIGQANGFTIVMA